MHICQTDNKTQENNQVFFQATLEKRKIEMLGTAVHQHASSRINLIRATLNSGKTLPEYRVSASSRRELITTVSTRTSGHDEEGWKRPSTTANTELGHRRCSARYHPCPTINTSADTCSAQPLSHLITTNICTFKPLCGPALLLVLYR